MVYESPPLFVKSVVANVYSVPSYGIGSPLDQVTAVTRLGTHAHVIGATSLPVQPDAFAVLNVNLMPDTCGKRPAQVLPLVIGFGQRATPFSSACQSWMPVTLRVTMLFPNGRTL